MKELIERLRHPVGCTLDDRLEAADALERLTGIIDADGVLCRSLAADIERLTAELKTCRYWREQEVNDLTAERDSLALDAKRYRWMRSVGAGVWPRFGTRCRVVAEGDSLDEYVDLGIEGKSV